MAKSFDELGLMETLVTALKKDNITIPTDIQSGVIPLAMKNRDVILQSETGTGKTLAYLLPIYEKIKWESHEMQAIVMVPTHELAIQVIRQIEKLSKNSAIKVTATPIIGGVNITRQIDNLKQKPHIIVGTPGRILELINKKKISAHTIKTIVVDEVDKLLDDNNIANVKAVVKTTLKERQLLMCSATIPAKIIAVAKELMKEPEIVQPQTKIVVPENIEHIYIVADYKEKSDVLRKLIRALNVQRAIVFVGNINDALEVEQKLKYHSINVDSICGANIKLDRKKAMDDFKSGKIQVLIASDIAARGLDISDVTHIFNVNIPEKATEYIHRAGRSGRNGNSGTVVSIATETEVKHIKKFERDLKIEITRKNIVKGQFID